MDVFDHSRRELDGVLFRTGWKHGRNRPKYIRGSGGEGCLVYIGMVYIGSTFKLECSFDWTKHYDADHYIQLQDGEVFDGNDFEINLSDVNDWKGLLAIAKVVRIPEDIPLIKTLHMVGGKTSVTGGFIVRSEQNNFIVDSCSSNETISGECQPCLGGGGICGYNREQCWGYLWRRDSPHPGDGNHQQCLREWQH